MSGQQIGYLRVSTIDQNTARQLDGVALSKTFTDKLSGKDRERPQLQAMIEYARHGDTVHVHSLDRLARNIEDLKNIIKSLTGKGVDVFFHKENMEFKSDAGGLSAMQELMFSMLASFAQFERAFMLERQREGIQKAKEQGKYRGGQPKLDEKQIKQLKDLLGLGLSKTKVAEKMGITRQTVYTYMKI
jgi:DNA invertase Pin-like site-specific DNA recombinase